MIPKTKDDDFYSVGEELEKHIKEMIQLERGISLEDILLYEIICAILVTVILKMS